MSIVQPEKMDWEWYHLKGLAFAHNHIYFKVDFKKPWTFKMKKPVLAVRDKMGPYSVFPGVVLCLYSLYTPGRARRGATSLVATIFMV